MATLNTRQYATFWFYYRVLSPRSYSRKWESIQTRVSRRVLSGPSIALELAPPLLVRHAPSSNLLTI